MSNVSRSRRRKHGSPCGGYADLNNVMSVSRSRFRSMRSAGIGAARASLPRRRKRQARTRIFRRAFRSLVRLQSRLRPRPRGLRLQLLQEKLLLCLEVRRNRTRGAPKGACSLLVNPLPLPILAPGRRRFRNCRELASPSPSFQPSSSR